MSQRLYILMTRSAILLILALLVAPLWDSWRYRGLLTSGGAGLPVGVIMSAPRPRPATAPAPGRVALSGDIATFEGVSHARMSLATQPGLPVAIDTPDEYGRPLAARETARVFEAWSARAQVDPFWDGDDSLRPKPPLEWAPSGTTEDGEDGVAGDPGDGLVDAGAADPGREDTADSSMIPVDDDMADADLRPEAQPGDPIADPVVTDPADAPAAAGWIGGIWPQSPAAEQADPAPVPEPPSTGANIQGRVDPPRPGPGDPKPAPAAIPSVSVIVTTPEVAPDDEVIVLIRIENADQITSLPFHILFDPAVLEFTGSQAGPALASLEPVLLASVSPNRPGDLAVGLSLIETAGTFSGDGDVVVLQFRALAPGRSDLTFSRATLRGPQSAPVEARYSNGYVTVR